MLIYNDIGEGEVVVLIHGLGSRKEAWESQYALSNYFRLIIPDLRGHGQSQVEEDISVENFAKDILQLLEQLHIESAHFCGLSLGGIIVQEIFKQAPEKVRSLILANTLSYIPPILGSMSVLKQKRAMKRFSQKDYLHHTVNHCLYNKENPYLYEKVKKSFFIRHSCYLDCASSSVGKNYLYLLPFIKKPVLIIGSKKDPVTPIQNSLMMKTLMPHATLIVLDKTGHVSNVENKDEFNGQLFDFLMKNKEPQLKHG